MKREDLTKLGIEDKKVVDSIMSLHGKGIEKSKKLAEDAESASGETNLKIEGLDKQLSDANDVIAGFKNMDIDAIKEKSATWEQEAKNAKVDADKRVSKLKLNQAIKDFLVSAKAKNPKAVRGLLKLDDIKLSEDGETLIGIDEQVKRIKTDDDYLFETDDGTPKIVQGTNTKGVIGDTIVNAAREAAGLDKAE